MLLDVPTVSLLELLEIGTDLAMKPYVWIKDLRSGSAQSIVSAITGIQVLPEGQATKKKRSADLQTFDDTRRRVWPIL
jgi:hypothetical protein